MNWKTVQEHLQVEVIGTTCVNSLQLLQIKLLTAVEFVLHKYFDVTAVTQQRLLQKSKEIQMTPVQI